MPGLPDPYRHAEDAPPFVPSQQRIWLGALATVGSSTMCGFLFAASHVVILFVILFPITILLTLFWTVVLLWAGGRAIYGAVRKRPWAPLAIGGALTAVLGAVAGASSGLTTSAYLASHQPAIDATGRPNEPRTFAEALLGIPSLLDATGGLMFGAILGLGLGMLAMGWAHERSRA